jgi:hypothetical protein
MVEGNRSRVPGWQALSGALAFKLADGRDVYPVDKDGRPVIKFTQQPSFFVFRSCVYTWNSLSTVIHDETKNVEDVKKTKGSYPPGEGDDEADCCRMGLLALDPPSIERDKSGTQPKKIKDPFALMSPKRMLREKYPFASF